MHIHDSNNFLYTNFNPTAAAEHATNRQRAENLRKRLMSSQNETDGIVSPEETSLIGHWMDAQNSHVAADDEYHPSSQQPDPESE
jgi:hypothetical protein